MGAGRVGGAGGAGGAGRVGDTGGADRIGRVGDAEATGAGEVVDGPRVHGAVGHAGRIADAGQSSQTAGPEAPGRAGAAKVTGTDEPVNTPCAPEPHTPLLDTQTSVPHVPRTQAQPAAPDPRDQSTPHSPPSPRPAQLPPPPAHFTGRVETFQALHDTLAPLSVDPGAQPLAVISVITGMAGVGKSALALHTAHALRNRFPDGQLYVNLHGATPGMTPLTPGQALHALLRDLGAEPRSIPEHPDAASALLRSLLAPTRTLMVLDDAENAAQVRPLLPAGTGCAVIVTSRSPLTALDGARRFPLTPCPARTVPHCCARSPAATASTRPTRSSNSPAASRSPCASSPPGWPPAAPSPRTSWPVNSPPRTAGCTTWSTTTSASAAPRRRPRRPRRLGPPDRP